MLVMVLGAGVIGTCCAYYLAKAGHDVAVVDRRSGPALETSFANAGGARWSACVAILSFTSTSSGEKRMQETRYVGRSIKRLEDRPC